jgi:hypothetical protein
VDVSHVGADVSASNLTFCSVATTSATDCMAGTQLALVCKEFTTSLGYTAMGQQQQRPSMFSLQ